MAEKLSCCIQQLPTEILAHIFIYLPAVTVVNIRRVCARWKCIIDSMNESFWLHYCVQDYKHMLNIIRHRLQSGISYFSLYKTFRLWPMVSEAKEVLEEFISTKCMFKEIRGFCLLPDNIIGVHYVIGINYYDTQTFTKLEQKSIIGIYQKYVENKDIVLLLDVYSTLKIIVKNDQKPIVALPKVTHILLDDNKLCYVIDNTQVCVCKYPETLLTPCTSKLTDVWRLGFIDDTLYVSTTNGSLFKIQDGNTTFVSTLKHSPSTLHVLNQYNFLEYIYSDWKYEAISLIPARAELCYIRIYGDIVFVGSKFGSLLIYYKPYVNGVFDIYNSTPMKQFDLVTPTSEGSYDTAYFPNPINTVDVIEGINKHIVFAAVRHNIFVVHLIH